MELTIANLISLAALAVSIVSAALAWQARRRKQIAALHQKIEAERDRRRHDVEDLRTRLTKAESRLDEAPTGKALHDLALSISDLAGEFKSVSARLDGLSEVVKRLETITNRQEEYLLNMPKAR